MSIRHHFFAMNTMHFTEHVCMLDDKIVCFLLSLMVTQSLGVLNAGHTDHGTPAEVLLP